jgi:hypothetical protein
MSRRTIIAGGLFVAAVAAGTATDVPSPAAPRSATVLTADLHVHAAPGDGVLPVWEIQREAARRGVDVIAITNHNHAVASRLARFTGLVKPYPLIIDSQELTSGSFHMAAVGVAGMIDWRLPAAEAIDAIHAAGGVAIAAHPGKRSWRVDGDAPLKILDGVEVAHSAAASGREAEAEMREFYERTRAVHPTIAPIGSSDFHVGAPMSFCRTYVLTPTLTREGVLEAIRGGRTVATCPGGRITGTDENRRLASDRMDIEQPMRFGYGLSTWLALAALVTLGAAAPRRFRDAARGGSGAGD